MTLVHPQEIKIIKAFERALNVRIKRLTVPSESDVHERQHEIWREKLEKSIEENNLASYRAIIAGLAEKYDSIDIGAAALKLLMSQSADKQRRSTECDRTGIEVGIVSRKPARLSISA